MKTHRKFLALVLAACCSAVTPAFGQDAAGVATEGACAPALVPTFGAAPGAAPGSAVFEIEVLDDGTGPALYAGGILNSFVNLTSPGLARFDGEQWSAVGSAVFGYFGAMEVFEHAPGSRSLFVAAWFLDPIIGFHVAQWNGTAWVSVGGADRDIEDLVVFDDGTGPALYAAGRFTVIGGVAANGIARWDGSSWSSVGGGVSGTANPLRVNTLEVFDEGSGPALFAGGNFSSAGGAPGTGRIARWDGSAWSALGSGVAGEVNIIKTLDLGSGPRLVVGGGFSIAGVAGAGGVAVWDGSAWSALTPGASSPSAIDDVDTFDSGAGPALHAIGRFTTTSVSVTGVARWAVGMGWSILGEISGETMSGLGGQKLGLASLELTGVPRLAVGGSFRWIDGVNVDGLASWDGTEFAGLGGAGVNNAVFASAVFNDGTGDALYVGGNFTGIGESTLLGIARWDGSGWSPVGDFPADDVIAMHVFDAGAGDELFVSQIEFSGSVSKWDGAQRTAFNVNGPVRAFTVFDDGTGPALYAGGGFTSIDGVAATNIARWDGAAWSAVGVMQFVCGEVRAMAVFDDGSGSALYTLDSCGRINRWNGAAWDQPAGVLIGSPFPGMEFNALVAFDDGSGPALYAGGMFTSASVGGGDIFNLTNIARWNGVTWERVGQGLGPVVTALAVVDTADGPTLMAGGRFGSGSQVQIAARWDGEFWRSINAVSASIPGVPQLPPVNTFSSFDDGSGPSVFFGGRFNDLPSGDSNLAKWGGCPASAPPCQADINGDGDVNGVDLLRILNSFGECPAGGACAADLNGDGAVNGTDLLILLNGFGACP